jgi:Fe-S cluster biogenesis protein NfuA
MAPSGQQVLDNVRQVEDLLERVDALPAPARDTATALVRALLGLYGEALTRIIEIGSRAGAGALADELTADDLVGHLLALHGLHPLDVPQRVARALSGLQLPGVQPELVGIASGVVRLRFGGGKGCGSSAPAVTAALEEAVYAAAPEIDRVEVEQVAAPAAMIPLDSLRLRIGARTGNEQSDPALLTQHRDKDPSPEQA